MAYIDDIDFDVHREMQLNLITHSPMQLLANGLSMSM